MSHSRGFIDLISPLLFGKTFLFKKKISHLAHTLAYNWKSVAIYVATGKHMPHWHSVVGMRICRLRCIYNSSGAINCQRWCWFQSSLKAVGRYVCSDILLSCVTRWFTPQFGWWNEGFCFGVSASVIIFQWARRAEVDKWWRKVFRFYEYARLDLDKRNFHVVKH